MGSRFRNTFLPIVVGAALIVPMGLVLGLASGVDAQSADPGTTQPDQLWSYDPAGDATINDVGIDSRGRLAAAVQGDAGAGNDDEEVFVWNLARSPETSEPLYGADPTTGTAGIDPTVPEDLNTVAVEPAEDGEPQYVAVGYGDGNSDIYVYSSRRGPESAERVTYDTQNENDPSGDVAGLWFMSSNWLVAQHDGDGGSLTLLKRTSGQSFEQKDKWPKDGGTLQDADLSGDGSRIIAATSSSSVGEPTTIELFVLERDGDKFDRITNTESRSRSSSSAVVDLDRTGQYALLGTGDNALFYYRLQTAPNEEREPKNFSAAWSARGSSAVTAAELSPDGKTFAAGFDDGEIVVYEQTELTDDGPLAARAVESGYDADGAVTELDFAENGRQLTALASSLYGFHARQFDPNTALEPLWRIPSITGVSVSADGNRLIASTDQTVRAYQQSYEASISVDAPAQLEPGQKTSIDVSVNNTGSTFDQYKLGTEDVPSTWTVGFNQTEIPLLPGESAQVTLNVTPDRTQAPTNLTFAVTAKSQKSPEAKTAAKTDVSVEIPVVRAASISTDDGRIESTRGQTSVIPVEITNDGNTDTSLRVSVDQEREWSVAIAGQDGTSRSFQVPRGDSQEVEVGLLVPDSAAEGSSNEVTIEVRAGSTGSGDSVTVTMLVEPSFGATVTGPADVIEVQPDTEKTFTIGVRNTGNTQDAYSLKVFSNATNPEHVWRTTLSTTQLTVASGSNETVDVTVNVPRGAVEGEATDVTVVARSQTTGEKADEATFRVEVPEETEDSPLGILLVPTTLGLVALARRRLD